MAKKRTAKSKYTSKYGGGFISSAQYLTEIICERKSNYDGRDIPHLFWRMPKWAKFFREQIASANQLLEKYSDKAVLLALNRLNNIYSLRNPLLEQYCKEEQAKIDLLGQMERTVVPETSPQVPRANTEQTKIGRLRALDG